MEEKKDESITQDITEEKEDSSTIQNLGIVVIVVAVVVVIGGYLFYYYTDRSVKKVEDVGDIKMDGDLSFEEMHKVGPSNLEVPSPGDEADDAGRQHFNAGVRFSLRGDYDRAIEEYKKALEYDPNAAEAYSNIGFAYMDKGEIEQSIVEQRKALDLNPNLANAYYGLALALEKKGDSKGAIKSWEKYLEIAPPGTRWWDNAKERLGKIKGD